jgi:hypothetical protein
MARPGYYGDFESLNFPKTGKEIVERAVALRDRVAAKIKEREGRIRDAAKEMGLKDAGDVLMSLQAISDGTSNGAGDLNLNVGLAAKVRGEVSEVQKERKEVEKLRLVIENLPQGETFKLSFAELTYFEW